MDTCSTNRCQEPTTARTPQFRRRSNLAGLQARSRRHGKASANSNRGGQLL